MVIMARQRGSMGLLLLVVMLVVAMLVNLVLPAALREQKCEQEAALSSKLRLLCGSAMDCLWEQRPPQGMAQVLEGVLEPGAEPVTVSCRSLWSADELIYCLETEALLPNHAGAVQGLRRLEFNLPTVFQTWAGQYALVAQKPLQGAEYLTTEGIYTSNEEVIFPQASFLQGKGSSVLTPKHLQTDGLGAIFYYIPQSSVLELPTGNIAGSGVIINRGRIAIPAGARFYDRVLLMSEAGGITIGKNAQLDKALLIAYGTVTVEAGCVVNGLIAANRIILKGASSFTADADVVAPFASAVTIM